jgi:predicted nucleic acid-binding protein
MAAGSSKAARATWPPIQSTWEASGVTKETILDTGPLVAFLAADEEHHDWAVSQFNMDLMRTYRQVPMSFADACLVRMAEMHAGVPVFTLDTDFQIYRKNRRELIPTIMPS